MRFGLQRLAPLARMPFIAAAADAAMLMLVGWSFGAVGAGLGWALFAFTIAFILLVAADSQSFRALSRRFLRPFCAPALG